MELKELKLYEHNKDQRLNVSDTEIRGNLYERNKDPTDLASKQSFKSVLCKGIEENRISAALVIGAGAIVGIVIAIIAAIVIAYVLKVSTKSFTYGTPELSSLKTK